MRLVLLVDMRIVLQHTTTELYLKSVGAWTPHLEEALNFGSSQQAIKFMRQHRLDEVQVLVAFVEDSVVDIVALQIPAAPPALRNSEDRITLPPAA